MHIIRTPWYSGKILSSKQADYHLEFITLIYNLHRYDAELGSLARSFYQYHETFREFCDIIFRWYLLILIYTYIYWMLICSLFWFVGMVPRVAPTIRQHRCKDLQLAQVRQPYTFSAWPFYISFCYKSQTISCLEVFISHDVALSVRLGCVWVSTYKLTK